MQWSQKAEKLSGAPPGFSFATSNLRLLLKTAARLQQQQTRQQPAQTENTEWTSTILPCECSNMHGRNTVGVFIKSGWLMINTCADWAVKHAWLVPNRSSVVTCYLRRKDPLQWLVNVFWRQWNTSTGSLFLLQVTQSWNLERDPLHTICVPSSIYLPMFSPPQLSVPCHERWPTPTSTLIFELLPLLLPKVSVSLRHFHYHTYTYRYYRPLSCALNCHRVFHF